MNEEEIKEEIKKEIEKCIKCGLCKEICPIFKELLIETYSPRGKILTIRSKNSEGKEERKEEKKEERKEEISFYCTTCNGCKEKCPLGIDVSNIMIYFRERENERGRERKANKRMIEKIRKYGNPFGQMTKKIPKELYCC